MTAIVDEIIDAVGSNDLMLLAERFNLEPDSVYDVIRHAAQLVLDGLRLNAADAAGLRSLVGALTEHVDPLTVDAVADGALGEPIVRRVFGDTAEQVTTLLGKHHQVPSQAAAQLLNLVAPMVMQRLAANVGFNVTDIDVVRHELDSQQLLAISA